MIEAPTLPHPSGSNLRRALVLGRSVSAGGWREDLRFFGMAYALGLVFFLLLLS